MAISEQLKIEIKAQANQALLEMKKVEKETDKLGNTLKTAFTAAAVVAGVKKMISMAKEYSELAAEQEAAVTRLNAALEVTGQHSESTSRGMQDFASELQRMSVIGDEVSLGLMQMGINMGLSAEETKTATQQAIALSRAYGINLNTAMIGVVNTMQGQTSTLTRYIPSLKAASDETERINILNDEAAKAWAVATEEVNTATGAQQQLQNAIGDTKEIIGQSINDSLTPFRQELVEIVTNINELMAMEQEVTDASKAVAEGIASGQQQVIEYQRQLDSLNNSYAEATRLGYANADVYEAQKRRLEGLIRSAQIRAGNEARAGVEAEERAAEEQRRAEEKAANDEAELKRLDAIAAAKAELAENEARTAELFKQAEADRLQALADRTNAEGEAALAEIAASRAAAQAKIDADKAAHEAKIAQIQEEIAMYSNFAYSTQQIFANLINSMMQGDDELTDKQKRNIMVLFRMQQAASIAKIAMDTASAITEALPNIPLSIVVGALGATQMAAAMAAKPPVMLADGGIVMPTPGGTSAIIGEGGKPEAVIPLDRIGGLGNITVIVNGSVGSQEDVATWVHEGIARAQQMGRIAA
jgi:hypothetical protein